MSRFRYYARSPLNWGRTNSRIRLSATLRARTTRPWTAHDTQYCCLMYNLGRVYSSPLPYLSPNLTFIDRSITNISLGGSINHVSHLETLDGLILFLIEQLHNLYLSYTTEAVGATNRVHMTSSLLRTTMISIRCQHRLSPFHNSSNRKISYLRLKGIINLNSKWVTIQVE